jgi:MHS family proline/betaine transporter-like MFS transporter
LVSNALAVATLAALLPVTGRICDRVGRKPMYTAGALWLFLCAYPAFRLAQAGTLLDAYLGQALLAVGVAIYGSALFVGLVELFPTAVRCRSHGISYNVSVALFGGATPLIATALIGATGDSVSPAMYAMAAIATIGLLGIVLVPETFRVGLRSSIFPETTPSRPASDSAVDKRDLHGLTAMSGPSISRS